MGAGTVEALFEYILMMLLLPTPLSSSLTLPLCLSLSLSLSLPLAPVTPPPTCLEAVSPSRERANLWHLFAAVLLMDKQTFSRLLIRGVVNVPPVHTQGQGCTSCAANPPVIY